MSAMSVVFNIAWLIVAGIVLYAFVPYFKAYWSERGKNLATKDDLIRILNQTQAQAEAKKRGETEGIQKDLQLILNQLRATTSLTKQIEADISYNAWDRQMRLSFKRDLYVRLLETMGEKIRTLRNVIYVETMLANLTLDQSRREDWKQKLREFYTTNDLLSSKFQTVASVAGISIPADARQVLDALAAESQRLARENMTDAQKTNIQKAEEEAMLFLEAFNQMGFSAKRDVGDME